MEIRPGGGVPEVQVGDTRAEIETRLGVPDRARDESAFYTSRDPALIIRFSEAGRVELIEIPYSGGSGQEATLAGVQLTYRPMDDVRADLARAGIVGRPSDIGFEYPQGFAIWSMSSLTPADIDTAARANDERLIVEGVSVGAPSYFEF